MLRKIAFALALTLVLAAALWLRTYDLARRPMHADEANQAVKAGGLLGSGRYTYDPRDHHGPTLYYAVLPVAWLRGERTLAALTETTVRLVPALAGTLAVALLAVLAWPLGRWPALAAAAFLALSPPAVYYSRYFIQETLLATATLAALVCAQQWWKNGYVRWALGAGACAGLMQATKASAPLFVLAAAAGLLVARPGRPASSRVGRDALLALAVAALVAGLFFSSFGAHPAGLGDAFATYGLAGSRLGAGETGHEKPWWYYLRLFVWMRHSGLVWDQFGFAVLAFAGFIGAFTFSRENRLLRWAAGYALVVIALFSFVSYKTPWHAVHFVPPLALLAAGALTGWRGVHRRVEPDVPGGPGLGIRRVTFAVVVILGVPLALMSLLKPTLLAAFARPADLRNPYAYVHSAPDVRKFRPLVEAALARAPDAPIRVIGEEYWPLPWYFRGLPRIGYWTTPPADCDGALVIVTATQADAVRARLRGAYTESFLGLRPGVLMIVFTRENAET